MKDAPDGLPTTTIIEAPTLENLTPRQIVEVLDKYIIGQDAAKRAMAIALRNRYRRRLLPPEVREDVVPKNIMMIGATGVGKTEIARRVANLSGAPFLKVEATRFTEVGYVGKDADSILQDLVESAVTMLYERKLQGVQDQAERLADERIIDYLFQQSAVPSKKKRGVSVAKASVAAAPAGPDSGGEEQTGALAQAGAGEQRSGGRERSQVARLLRSRRLDDTVIEIELSADIDPFESVWEFSTGMSQQEVNEGLRDFMESYSSTRGRSKKLPVKDARRILAKEEAAKLVDYEGIVELALQQAQENGIVFIDEIDKVAVSGMDIGSDISGEGVQRDLLPIIEGTTVMTRYGPAKSDYVLFIAAGSFSRSKPSDLIPELQGRFPLRVELQSLGLEEMKRVLVEPKNALIKQYTALLSTEGVELSFTEDGITEIADTACRMNRQLEDIGARRLQTIMEKVLEEVSFQAAGMPGEVVQVDASYVRERVAKIAANEDLSRYIL